MKKLLLISAILFSHSMNAQWTGAVIDTLTHNSLRDEVNHQCMAIGPQERLHLVFKQENSISGWNIFYKQRDANLVWSADEAVSPQAGFNAVIAPSYTPGEAYIAFDGEDSIDHDEEIFFCSNSSGSWICDQLTNDTLDDSSPTIATDSAGHIHLAWIATDTTGNYKIVYANNISGSWAIQVIANSQLGAFGSGAVPEIAVENSGVVHIAYRGGNSGSYKIHHAFNSSPGDSTWNFDYINTPNAEDLTPSIQIGSDSSVHLLVTGNDGFGFPMKTYYLNKPYTSVAFTTVTAVAGSFSASVGDLFVDHNNLPHCVLNEVNGNIYTGNVIYTNANNWGGSTLLGTGDIYEANMVVDAEDHAFMVGYKGNAFPDEEIIFYGTDATVGTGELALNENLIRMHSDENNITLQFANAFDGNISCNSAEGKIVFNESGTYQGGQSLLIRNLSKGLYIIHANGKDGTFTKKIFVR